MTLSLVINKTDQDLQNYKLGDEFVDWECIRCKFSRPIQMKDLILTTKCPRCTDRGAS